MPQWENKFTVYRVRDGSNPFTRSDFRCPKQKKPRHKGGVFAMNSVSSGYIMSSMPPPGIGFSFFGNSATIASVVSIRPATEAAFCSA